MSLDILIYTEKENKIISMSETLHKSIFSYDDYKNYKQLRKIKDYYLADETFYGASLANLIAEFEKFKEHGRIEFKYELIILIDYLKNKNVETVRFSGD
ncbi:hypothetical protein [Marinobacterium iners]|uniref:Uncharacterized protein n=1 Tax=Marinobacterium iners DSM 11526 TaxID=1122198 RepID=A0A1H4GWD1_9GAMM|nr:hypothetical protein [Marinobacterium iners]SEB13906.1 hypothetical protein SAMN02745729_12152 [Marinobacterium iners DSM 11526]